MTAAQNSERVHAAVASALDQVHMDGAVVEFAVVAWPAGRRVVAVNITTSKGVTLDRVRDALEYGAAQIEAAEIK